MLKAPTNNLAQDNDESKQNKQDDLLSFVQKTVQETSKRIDNEITPKKTQEKMKKRPKTHTRHIINNMNQNGMNYYPYLKCYQKIPPTYPSHKANLKCYMDESVKALFRNENGDDCTFRIKQIKKKSLTKLRKNAIKRKKRPTNEGVHNKVKPVHAKPQGSKSPSSIPLDKKFDDPIISSVLDDFLSKGSFNDEFEELFCSTFSSSQTL